MEPKNQFQFDGQEAEQDDLNQIIGNAALADDHVFAELLRLCPLSPGGGQVAARGIMPWGFGGIRDVNNPLPKAQVVPNGAAGSVLVAPFRAFIGSRTLSTVDALLNFRDMRSALSVVAGSTSLTQVASFAANASGNPRWDYIVAAVTIDGNGPSVTRYVKDTTDDNATPQTVVATLITTVTLQVVTGTPAASPVPPAVPADTSNIYYVPIAVVRIPNGFTVASTVATGDIAIVPPLVAIGNTAGGLHISPADTLFGALLSAGSNAGWKGWGSSGVRPPSYMPSTARGGFMKEICLDLSGGSHSIAPGQAGVVDASRDWRGRRFIWLAILSTTNGFPWESASNPGGGIFGGLSFDQHPAADTPKFGSGQSVYPDAFMGGSGLPASTSRILQLDSTSNSSITGGITIQLGVDQTTPGSGGALIYSGNGAVPACKVWIFMIATGQFESA